MSRSSAAALCAVLAAAPWPAPPRAAEGAVALRAWAAPERTWLRADSPFAPGAAPAGLGRDRGSAEAVLRLSGGGAAAEASLRGTADPGGGTASAVVTELFQELDVAGQHLTVGKKVTSWGVGFGYRSLDVVQQERRRALRPFALEGIPQLAWEWLDERRAVTVLWANPLQGRAAVPVHDESVAVRGFARAGPADLHAVGRYAARTGLQAGAGLSAVVGEALELHAEGRWQAREEHLPAPAPGAPVLSAVPPGPPDLRRDTLAGLLGLTVNPGLDLSVLVEAWIDPGGDRPATWRARRRLAEAQRALGEAGLLPSEAVAGNLAWGLRAFDRQDPLPEGLLLHLARPFGRLEPTADLVLTPEDRGWVATAATAWQGERLRFEGGLRIMGGPPGAAYRLYPGWAAAYLAVQVQL